eukprot:scaffold140_cov565-Prasinococcus_capsulatus_cf.AAC.30
MVGLLSTGEEDTPMDTRRAFQYYACGASASSHEKPASCSDPQAFGPGMSGCVARITWVHRGVLEGNLATPVEEPCGAAH